MVTDRVVVVVVVNFGSASSTVSIPLITLNSDDDYGCCQLPLQSLQIHVVNVIEPAERESRRAPLGKLARNVIGRVCVEDLSCPSLRTSRNYKNGFIDGYVDSKESAAKDLGENEFDDFARNVNHIIYVSNHVRAIA